MAGGPVWRIEADPQDEAVFFIYQRCVTEIPQLVSSVYALIADAGLNCGADAGTGVVGQTCSVAFVRAAAAGGDGVVNSVLELTEQAARAAHGDVHSQAESLA